MELNRDGDKWVMCRISINGETVVAIKPFSTKADFKQTQVLLCSTSLIELHEKSTQTFDCYCTWRLQCNLHSRVTKIEDGDEYQTMLLFYESLLNNGSQIWLFKICKHTWLQRTHLFILLNRPSGHRSQPFALYKWSCFTREEEIPSHFTIKHLKWWRHLQMTKWHKM